MATMAKIKTARAVGTEAVAAAMSCPIHPQDLPRKLFLKGKGDNPLNRVRRPPKELRRMIQQKVSTPRWHFFPIMRPVVMTNSEYLRDRYYSEG
jgi:hypothetical protein